MAKKIDGYIKSLGKKNVEKYIGPKPDYENNPGIIADENLMLFQEQHVPVNPKDDDVAHMNGHQEFKRKMAGVLSMNAMQMLVMHILEHRHAYAMKLQQQAAIGQGGQDGSKNQGAGGVPSAPGMGAIQGPRVQPATGPNPTQPTSGSPQGGQY